MRRARSAIASTRTSSALVIGTLLVALGLTFYAEAGILTSGLAGLSLLD